MGRWAWIGLTLAAALLAPWWGGGLLTNGGLIAWQRGDATGAAQNWATTGAWPGPGGERARLASVAYAQAGDPVQALAAARQGADQAPHAPLVLLQWGQMAAQAEEPEAALAAWRAAGAGHYFCTAAATALYHTTPPAATQAVQAARNCTTLDPQAGDGWLILGQAQTILGNDGAALVALDSAYTVLLARGQTARAGVAAGTALAAAGRADPAQVAEWQERARAIAPTVCPDPARPADPTLDQLCREFGP